MKAQKKILIVDDDEDFLTLYGKKLVEFGFQVAKATNSSECEELMITEKPNLILLDISLGPEDGTELYNQLIEKGLDHGVPVIFLSALAEEMDVSKAHEGRKYALLSKGIKISELIRQMECMMKF